MQILTSTLHIQNAAISRQYSRKCNALPHFVKFFQDFQACSKPWEVKRVDDTWGIGWAIFVQQEVTKNKHQFHVRL